MANIKIQFTSVGGQAVEAQFQSIIKGASATSQQIVALSQTLNTTAKGAATFASNIGLSVGEVTRVTNSFNALRSQGLSLTETFKILQRETGINASQYKALVTQLKSAETQTKDYIKALKDEEEAKKDTADASAAQILALQQVNQAAQQVSQALNAFTQQAVGAFIEYEDALTTLRAKATPTTDEMARLEESILQVALVTSQTPASAAKAATSFISVGAGAKGAADNLLVAAQITDAFQGDFTVAAKVVQLGANIFKDFGETAESVGDKITYISNTTAAGSTNGLDEYLQLFSKAAPLAKDLGVGLDELLAAFGVLRDAGQAPEVAATSLKSLQSTIIDSQEDFKKFGIEIFDSNNKFIGLTETFKRISETTSNVSGGVALTASEISELGAVATKSGLTIQQLNDIFGKIGISSALTLANGYEQVAQKTAAVSEQFGTLSKQAAIVNSSIQGQINLLTGSFESALVDIGKSLSGITAPAVAGVLELVNAFLSAPPAIKNFIGVSLGVATAASGAVAALTGYALALKALEVAQVGTTLKTIAASTAAFGYATANAGLTASFAPLTASVLTFSASLGRVLAALAPITIALAGVVATGALVKSSLDSSTSANRAKGAIEGLNKAIEDYNKVTGQEVIPKAEKTKNRFEELGGALKDLGKEIVFRADNFQAFGIGSTRAESGARGLAIATADLQPALSGLTNEFLRYKQAGELGSDFAQQSLLPALENAKFAIAALQAEGAKNINTTAVQTDQWRVEQEALTGLIEEIKGAAVATKALDVATKEAIVTYQELADALANTEGTIETDLLNAQRDAYAELGDNKVALENRLFELEQDSLKKRLVEQQQFLKDINTATFESEAEKNAKIGEAKQTIAKLELDIAKETSDRQLEIQEESIKAREELLREGIEREKAILESAAQSIADAETNLTLESVKTRLGLYQKYGEDKQSLEESLTNQELVETQKRIDNAAKAIDQLSKLKFNDPETEQSRIEKIKGLEVALYNDRLSLEQQLAEQKQENHEEQIARFDAFDQIALDAIAKEIELLNSGAATRSQLVEFAIQENEQAAILLNTQKGILDSLLEQAIAASDRIAAMDESAQKQLTLNQLLQAQGLTLADIGRQYENNKQFQEDIQTLQISGNTTIADLEKKLQENRDKQYELRVKQINNEYDLSVSRLRLEEQRDELEIRGELRRARAIEDERTRVETIDQLNTDLAITNQLYQDAYDQAAIARGTALDVLSQEKEGEAIQQATDRFVGAATGAASDIADGLSRVGDSISEGIGKASSSFAEAAAYAQKTFAEAANKYRVITRETISGVDAPAGVGSIVGDGELALSTSEEILSQIRKAFKEQTRGSEYALDYARQAVRAATKRDLNFNPNDLPAFVQAGRGATLIQRQQEQWLEALKKIGNDDVEALRDLASEIRNNAVTVASKISTGAFGTAADVRVGIPGRASGGSVAAFQPYIVGERGRELFIPSQPGTIVPNNRIAPRSYGTIAPRIGVRSDADIQPQGQSTRLSQSLKVPNLSALSAPLLPASYSPQAIVQALSDLGNNASGASFTELIAEIQGLRRDIAQRPIPTIDSNFTFINEPDPLQSQIALLQGQLRAGRAIV